LLVFDLVQFGGQQFVLAGVVEAPTTYAAAMGPISERVKPIDWATLMPLTSSTALAS
jgi:hypothetical protein